MPVMSRKSGLQSGPKYFPQEVSMMVCLIRKFIINIITRKPAGQVFTPGAWPSLNVSYFSSYTILFHVFIKIRQAMFLNEKYRARESLEQML